MRASRKVMVALLSIGIAGSAFATAQRTFVSASANDSNPCSLTQPCRSFAAAIAHTNPGGEVVVLDSAGYGPVTIANDVSLIAPPGVHAGISVFAGDGVAINAPSATVVLRGIAIDGQGGTHGINVQAAQRVRIENCIISNMTGNGLNLTSANTETIVSDTTIRGNGVGIAVNVNAPLVLERVHVEQNNGQGLALSAAGNSNRMATITDSTIVANGQEGISVTPPANAIAQVQIERTVVSHNGGVGVLLTAAAGADVRAIVMRSTIAHNDGDGVFVSSSAGAVEAVATLAENLIAANAGFGVLVTGSVASAILTRNMGIPGPGSEGHRCLAGGLFGSLGDNMLGGSAGQSCYLMNSGE